MNKRIVSLIVALCLLCSMLPMSASATSIIASGTCGRNLSWKLDENGLLTISGTGAMTDFDFYDYEKDAAPWATYSNQIETVVVNDGVTSIGEDAFWYCENLKSIEISNSVISLGNYSIYGCDMLTSVRIGKGLTTIGSAVFDCCDNLSDIVIDPDNPYFCTDESSVIYDAEKTTLVYAPTGLKGQYIIPECVAHIANDAFMHCEKLTEIVMQEGIVSIGSGAFVGCTSLTSVEIPDGVTQIENSTFSGCNFETVTIPNTITAIRRYAFFLCENITDVFYSGTKSEWSAIEVYRDNECLTQAPYIHYSVTNPVNHWSTIIVDATCGEDGFSYEQCNCGYRRNDVTIPATGEHIFDQEIVDERYLLSEATCTSPALYYRSCICGAIGAESFEHGEMKEHDYKTIVQFPSCTEKGFSTHTCTVCGESYIDSETEPLGHTEETDNAETPTCTKTGLTEGRHCSVCGEILVAQVVIPALGHTEDIVPAVSPTCTETGLTEGKNCSVCGEILVAQESLDALGHDMSQWERITAPTCTEDGIENRSCSRCDRIENRAIEAMGHRYSAVATAPTCTEKGYTTHTCANCNDSYTDTFMDALGHAMGNWVTDFEPTCTEEGKQYRVCFRCTYSEERTIEATGHSYITVVTAPTCTEQGYTTYTCPCGDSYISDYVDALGHDMGEWKTVTAPTCTENGSESRSCSRCDYTETRSIDAVGHIYTGTVTAPTCTEQGFTTYTCSCGDTYVSDEVPALGHTEETIPAVAATCIETGLTEGKKCSVCGEVLVAQEVEPALGHDWKGTSCQRCDATRENPFADVADGSFYIDPVLWAVENGITNGTTPTTFNPNGTCLRAHVVTFLYRAAKSPEPSSTKNPFADVKAEDFYYKPVLWAVEKGITNGISANKFGSMDVCNRAAVVTFLWRAAGSPEPESTNNPFEDVKTTDFFYKPVLWAVENGITNGVDATHFGPGTDCNRAQVVTFLYRAYN